MQFRKHVFRKYLLIARFTRCHIFVLAPNILLSLVDGQCKHSAKNQWGLVEKEKVSMDVRIKSARF